MEQKLAKPIRQKKMKRIIILILTTQIFFSCMNPETQGTINDDKDLKSNQFNNITLEMSLKPFKKNDKEYISGVCRKVFTQWSLLLRHADTVSVMLWTADGSEIPDYPGELFQPLEWAKYMENPNINYEVNSSPNENLTLHERAFTYIKNPPAFNYGELKFIGSELKKMEVN